MRVCKLHIVFGLLIISTGLLVPASGLISSLRPIPEENAEELLLGAKLFKLGLIIIGALVIMLGKSSIWRSDSAKTRNSSGSQGKLVPILLSVSLFAAMALRVYRLNGGLWLDEILTLVNYAEAPIGEIITTYDSQNQHFLYSVFARICILLFGQSVWSFRLPAVLFGVGSIWAAYLFGRQVSSTREALLSAALLTFSYHHIWFSQNARGYIMLLFFTLVASWLVVRGVREKRPRLWIAYAVVAALGAYVHISMIFIVMGHFVICLVILISRRRELCQIKK